jgi:polar amino acid transport system substrate-binding protein
MDAYGAGKRNSREDQRDFAFRRDASPEGGPPEPSPVLRREAAMFVKRWSMVAAAFGLAAAIGGVGEAADCAQDTLCRIITSGKLKAGVVVDYKPWGYRGGDGEFLGLEPDMARDVAETLGVEVEFVQVNSANRMEFLAQGQIDLMIATMTDNLQRREVIGIVHPNYYSSGYNIIMPQAAKPPSWDALEGQKICAIQGSWYNRPAQEEFGLDYLAFPGITEVEAALLGGRCIGWLFDDNLINVMFADPSGKWSGFHMPLPSQDDAPWGLAVRLDDLDKPWGRFMSGMLYEWHRSGQLLAWEQEHGVAESPFLRKSHETFKDHLKK